MFEKKRRKNESIKINHYSGKEKIKKEKKRKKYQDRSFDFLCFSSENVKARKNEDQSILFENMERNEGRVMLV